MYYYYFQICIIPAKGDVPPTFYPKFDSPETSTDPADKILHAHILGILDYRLPSLFAAVYRRALKVESVLRIRLPRCETALSSGGSAFRRFLSSTFRRLCYLRDDRNGIKLRLERMLAGVPRDERFCKEWGPNGRYWPSETD